MSNAHHNPIRTLHAKAGVALLLACMAVMATAGAKYFPPGPNAPTSASTAYPPGPTAPMAAPIASPPGPSAPAVAVADFPLGPGVIGPDI